MKLQKDLNEFLELLVSHKVEFLVVGAHAVAFHGHPRLTGDIDFLIRQTAINVENLEMACRAFGFTGEPFVKDEFLKPGQVFQLGRPPNRIDLLTTISGVPSEVAWSNRIAGQLSGNSVFYLSKTDLITNKKSTGRLKDLADVEVLEKR